MLPLLPVDLLSPNPNIRILPTFGIIFFSEGEVGIVRRRRAPGCPRKRCAVRATQRTACHELTAVQGDHVPVQSLIPWDIERASRKMKLPLDKYTGDSDAAVGSWVLLESISRSGRVRRTNVTLVDQES